MEIYRNKVRPVKEKKKPGREPTFTAEYMTMVARKVVDEGMTFREAARTFGISQGAVSMWKKKYLKGEFMSLNRKETKENFEAKTYVLEDQIKDLKKEIGELYLENLMLKKALFHSRRIKKENSSVITSENLDQFQKGAE